MLRHMFLAAALVVAFIAGTFVPTVHSQSSEAPAKWVTVSYMKSVSGKDPMAIEREVWKPLHEAMVREGKLKWWSVYQRRFPNGEATEYDYVTVKAHDKFADLEAPYAGLQQIFSKVHPGKNVVEIARVTNEARHRIRQDVLELVEYTAQ